MDTLSRLGTTAGRIVGAVSVPHTRLCNETLAHATRTSVEDVASVATSERHDSALVFVQFDVRLE